jgi:hypothetical protein
MNVVDAVASGPARTRPEEALTVVARALRLAPVHTASTGVTLRR